MANLLHDQQDNPAREDIDRAWNRLNPARSEVYPYVFLTYRLTEHHTAGGMSRTLPYLSELVSECAKWSMPVLAEMLPAGFENPAEMWTAENIGHACRIGAELGADFIKTTYSGDVESFRKIVEQVYVPIVVLGGTKSVDPRVLLESFHGAIQAGASGVACGRNISQCDEPVKMASAIAAIVHDGASVEDALEILQ